MNNSLTRRILQAGFLSAVIGCANDVKIPTHASTTGGDTAATPAPAPSPSNVPSNVAIAPSPVPQLALGDSVALVSLVTNATGQQLNAAVAWTSSNNAIASVNAQGVVTAKLAGVAVVTGTVNVAGGTAVVGSTSITVMPPAPPASVKSIIVSLTNTNIATTATALASATLKDSIGQALPGRTVTWTSDGPAVAMVNPTTGIVTGVSAGTCMIMATSGSITGAMEVTVTGAVTPPTTPPAAVQTITVSLSSVGILPTATAQATPTLKDAAGLVLTGRSVTWTSAAPSVATINSATGVITGVAVGTSTITATSGSVSGSATITVTSAPLAAVKAITVSLSSASIFPAATSQATPTLKDSLGQVLASRTVTWMSSSPSIASVNATTGVITGVTVGTSTITATFGTVTGSATITVTPTPVATVKTITVALSSQSIAPSATSLATATLKDSLARVMTGHTVTWTSTNSSVATVNAASGVVTGVAAGTSTITATSGTVNGSATITVVANTPPPPSGPMTGARLATGPTSFVNSAYVAPSTSAHIYHVLSGQSLQARIDSAKPGDVILIAAGGTFTGPFTLKPKTGGTAPIIIRSDAPDAQLPAEGVRITPSSASLLPKLVATVANNFVITTVPRAANYRLMFLEVAPVAGNDLNTLVRLGSSNSDQPVLDSIPSNIILDRVYLHGLTTNNLVRCVQIHGAGLAIVDSYLSEAHANGQDSQAIVGWNGPGPYKIVNNFLSAAGENVMFGGSDPLIPGMIASDIVMQHNYVWKDPAWKGSIWSVKNHLEFKTGQRALIEANVFENNWVAAQTGLSILIKSTNQNGGFTGAVSRDIIFRSNRIKNVVSGITIAARPDGPAIAANLVTVVNNIFEDVSPGSATGIGMRLNADVRNIVFQNNTMIFAPGGGLTTVQFDRGTGPGSDSVAFNNNVFAKATYGVLGLDGGGGEGTNSLTTYHASFTGNVMNGVSAPQYPSAGGNMYPATLAMVYPSWQSYSYSISTSFRNAGTNAKDPGADIAAVLSATANVP